jgi:hypothetical protein
MADTFYRDRAVPTRAYKTNGKKLGEEGFKPGEEGFYALLIVDYDGGDIESLPWHDAEGSPWHKDYSQNRRENYPSIADQLDDIYHNGIDGWKATIKTTKDKYPK